MRPAALRAYVVVTVPEVLNLTLDGPLQKALNEGAEKGWEFKSVYRVADKASVVIFDTGRPQPQAPQA